MTEANKESKQEAPVQTHSQNELVYMIHPAIGGTPATVSFAAYDELYKDRGWTLVPAAKQAEFFEITAKSTDNITPEEG